MSDKLEIINYLINRYDGLRSSLSNRSAIILSTNAVLLGATTFLLDKINSDSSILYVKVVFSILILLFLISIFVSVICAVSLLAEVKINVSRSILGNSIPTRIFYHGGESISHFKIYEDFEGSFLSATETDFIKYGMSELWFLQHKYNRKYSTLRKSIKYLFTAGAIFLIIVVIFCIRYII